jgi:hypothetical protein
MEGGRQERERGERANARARAREREREREREEEARRGGEEGDGETLEPEMSQVPWGAKTTESTKSLCPWNVWRHLLLPELLVPTGVRDTHKQRLPGDTHAQTAPSGTETDTHTHMATEKGTESERGRDGPPACQPARRAGRQAGRQTDRQTGRQTGRQTDRPMGLASLREV